MCSCADTCGLFAFFKIDGKIILFALLCACTILLWIMIDSLSPLHPSNFANHSSRTSAREHRSVLSFHLSMFRRPSPPAVPYVRYKRSVLPFSCPSFRPDGLRNLPCPARIQPRICCSCVRFRLFLFSFHPVLASVVRCSIRMVIRPSGTWLVSRRCEWVRAWFPPVARRRMVVWCFFVGV